MLQGYRDNSGAWIESSEASIKAVQEELSSARPDPKRAPIVLHPGDKLPFYRSASVVLEDGSRSRVRRRVPNDFPLGYHELEMGPNSRRLIVAPPACVLPRKKTWGWAVQLYAARSSRSWGIGDLSDLGRIADWAANQGAGYVMINPISAVNPGDKPEPSPYFPSSRKYRNPLYIDVGRVPGADGLERVHELAQSARRLNEHRLIDRSKVWAFKSEALEILFRDRESGRRFDEYVAKEGSDLKSFATFCAISEQYGPDRRSWPEELSGPRASGVPAFQKAGADRIQFFSWLQWILEMQFEDASSLVPVVNDLAVGADPSGAEVWMYRDAFAEGAAVGAPPDAFNRRGQSWGFHPFNPIALKNLSYEPFIQTIRSSLWNAGGMRIDHVMGLFRLWWIPEGRGPAEGAYVTYPWRDLVSIVALESVRAGAFVIGEDLGTVEPSVREALAQAGVLSYRLLIFEGPDTSKYPVKSLAAVSTHDLPTIAGAWSRADFEAQERLGMDPSQDALEALRKTIGDAAGSQSNARVEDVVRGAYKKLCAAPSLLVAAGLEDVLEVEERPNFPGTMTEWPNWSIALPITVEAIQSDARAASIAEIMKPRSIDPTEGPGNQAQVTAPTST
ncbi:MAG TPA: 4-alpha-glucanotransferase [Actinomycetota bacterium]|nr:4-alpha-glucanotransferase [Actinomycetota bacterium]